MMMVELDHPFLGPGFLGEGPQIFKMHLQIWLDSRNVAVWLSSVRYHNLCVWWLVKQNAEFM